MVQNASLVKTFWREHSSNQWELYGINSSWYCKVPFDLQILTKYLLVQAWNRLVVHSTHRGSCTAYYSRTDNVRAHADMKICTLKRPIQHIILHLKGHNLCLQGLHGIDIITPWTSTVDYAQDYNTEKVARFRCVMNKASDKRLLCLDCLYPTQCPLRIVIGLISGFATLGTA